MSKSKPPSSPPGPVIHYLTLAEVSRRLGVHPRTLKVWRDEGLFPEPHVLGRSVLRYRSDIIDKWMATRDPLGTKKVTPI